MLDRSITTYKYWSIECSKCLSSLTKSSLTRGGQTLLSKDTARFGQTFLSSIRVGHARFENQRSR